MDGCNAYATYTVQESGSNLYNIDWAFHLDLFNIWEDVSLQSIYTGKTFHLIDIVLGKIVTLINIVLSMRVILIYMK